MDRVNDKPVIAFCGTGGTGKTETMQALSAMFTEHGIKHIIQPSIVRGYYASQGLTCEADYKVLSVDKRIEFQEGLFKHFIATLDETIVNNPGVKILCDRSAFDHFAYRIYGGPISLDTYYDYQDALIAYTHNVRLLVYFPFPVSFTQEKATDNFRDGSTQYNLIISSLMHRLTSQLTAYGRRIDVLDDTVDNRADDIYNTLQFRALTPIGKSDGKWRHVADIDKGSAKHIRGLGLVKLVAENP